MTHSGGRIGPNLPIAPLEYNRSHMDALIRRIELVFQQIFSPGSAVFTDVKLLRLQANGNGLPVDAIFQDGGFLRIVREGEAFPDTLSMTASVGSVTVTIA